MTHIRIGRTQEFEDGPKILERMAGRSRVLLEQRAIVFREYVRRMDAYPLPAKNFSVDFLNEAVFVDKFYPPVEGNEFLRKLSNLIVVNAPETKNEDGAYFALFHQDSQNLAACVFFTGVVSAKLIFWDVGEFQTMRLRLEKVAQAGNVAEFIQCLRKI